MKKVNEMMQNNTEITFKIKKINENQGKETKNQHGPEHQWVNEEIKRYLETEENGNKTYKKLWYATEADLKKKIITINSHLKTQKKYQINN